MPGTTSVSALCHAMVSHFSHVRLFATLWTVAHQVPLSMGFSRQEFWSGLPCPPPSSTLFVVQSRSPLWDPMDSSTPPDSQASLSFTVSQRLLKLLSTESVMPSNHLILCCPLLLLLLQSFPASGSFPMSQFFSSGGQSIGVSASASVLPMNMQN